MCSATATSLEADAPQAVQQEQEVTIRRRPPSGVQQQGCGPMKFRTEKNDGNTPRNILEEIIWFKAQEVDDMKHAQPMPSLMLRTKLAQQTQPPRDFIGALHEAAKRTSRPGLIAEVKKASPSRGVIQADFDHIRIAKQYEAGGAACLSVLTDARYFQGSFNFLREIREAGVSCPLLCKEFIVEAYQLYKARANGADAVLLIASVLPNKDLGLMLKVAKTVGLQCLIEVHTIGELERVLKLDLDPSTALLGINNRDLETFEVTLENTRIIMESAAGKQVQDRGLLMLSESGIFTPDDVAYVEKCGCGGILVGESLVKQPDTTIAVQQLLA
jgi:indole-3-glycerol phosphate synthase